MFAAFVLALAFAVARSASPFAAAAAKELPDSKYSKAIDGEVSIPLPSGGWVALSTKGPSAFRVRLLEANATDNAPLESPMVDPDGSDAAFTLVAWKALGKDTACRLNTGDNSTDGHGKTINKTTGSLEECMAICEQVSGCQGIEFQESKRTCAFWASKISSTEEKPGFECWKISDDVRHAQGITVKGLGSLTVTPRGQMRLRGPHGQVLTESYPLMPSRPPMDRLVHAPHPGGFFHGGGRQLGTEQVWSGDMVYLRAHAGMYLHADGDVMQASRLEEGDGQQFLIERKNGMGEVRHGDVVSLFTHAGRIVEVRDGQARVVEAQSGKDSEFVVEREFGGGVVQVGDRVFLRTHIGKYLDVQESDVLARWDDKGDWQTFVVDKSRSHKDFLRSGDSIFLEVEKGLLALSKDMVLESSGFNYDTWQRFVVQKVQGTIGERIFSGDKVFLMTHAGTAVDIEVDVVQARWNKKGMWQQLVIENEKGGPIVQMDAVSFRSHIGPYIEVQGPKQVRAQSYIKQPSMVFRLQIGARTCTQVSALKGVMTASSVAAPDGSADRASDLDGNTAWTSGPSHDQWLLADLGSLQTASRVEILWDKNFAESYFVQGSADGEHWLSLAFALGRDGWVVTALPRAKPLRFIRIKCVKAAVEDAGYGIREMAVHVCQHSVRLTSLGGHLYGKGGSAYDAHYLTSRASQPQVFNRAAYVPYYYSSDGYGALAVAPQGLPLYRPQIYPASYETQDDQVVWGYIGALELYLMPAKTLDLGTKAYFALTGAPRVPPRYAFGFIAARWGWKDKDYIEKTLQRFRKDRYPLDSIILGFEWFTNESDYNFAPSGKSWYKDFGFSKGTLPHPKEQLSAYERESHVRIGGSRKPRLGNTNFLDTAHAKGWTLPGGVPGGTYPADWKHSFAHSRNLNFSISEVRHWYARQLLHLLNAGVHFWFNDEGETDFFTYHYWNVAQSEALRSSSETSKEFKKRFFSLNRAFTPGLARLGATVWTGDLYPSWEDLQRSPGVMLNWALAGAPYVGCDIGGFAGDTEAGLLTRWMQAGAFMPLMMVHSWLRARPHWPWLFGDEASSAMRAALDLRYRLVPYHYSLAHQMFQKRKLWMRPLIMEFPEDSTAAALTTQWMDGAIMVAPVLRKDSRKQVYLPEGTWYAFNSSRTISGPIHLGGSATMDEIPAYVRPGTIVTMSPVMQSVDELPGGPLELHVYSGADGSFELVEDDGDTVAYESTRVRTTTFRWYDSAGTLSWRARGSTEDPGRTDFKELVVTIFGAGSQVRLPKASLHDGGSVMEPHSEVQV